MPLNQSSFQSVNHRNDQANLNSSLESPNFQHVKTYEVGKYPFSEINKKFKKKIINEMTEETTPSQKSDRIVLKLLPHQLKKINKHKNRFNGN
mmetsp:Transcript_17439/g.19594  ORF Transcript_17439/g.19594 Transcript_17439/m.19594 type:complete len:93 (+) Transcript_17439:413-691(+)